MERRSPVRENGKKPKACKGNASDSNGITEGTVTRGSISILPRKKGNLKKRGKARLEKGRTKGKR